MQRDPAAYLTRLAHEYGDVVYFKMANRPITLFNMFQVLVLFPLLLLVRCQAESTIYMNLPLVSDLLP
jgi:hypothetical protein